VVGVDGGGGYCEDLRGVEVSWRSRMVGSWVRCGFLESERAVGCARVSAM